MGFIDKIQEKDLPDYQQQFSSRTMKNYVAQALVPFGTNSLSGMLFSSYLSFVYTQYLGVAANVIAVIISIGIIVDGVTDFLMGFIVDRYRTKWGKAKHWFFISALPVGATMVLMFMIPESTSQMAKAIYVFVMYNLFCTALTTVRLPGGSLIALVSDSPKVHRNLAYIVEVASAFAGSTLGWIMAPMLSRYGDNLQTYRYITFICGAITVIALLLIGLLTTEQRTKEDWIKYDEEYKKYSHQEKGETIFIQMKNLLSNKWWVILQLYNLAQACCMNFNFGVMAYWLALVVGDSSKVGMIIAACSLPVTVGSLCYAPISRFFSSRKMIMLCRALQFVFGVIGWIAGAKHFSIYVMMLVPYSFLGGLVGPCSRVLIPQIIDYGEWKTGTRQEGLANSGTVVMNKIMAAVATSIVGFVLAASGYVGGNTVVNAGTISTINFLYLGVPTLMTLVSAVIMFFFRLDDKQVEQYKAEIAARNAALDQEA